ncbi:MAG: histidinol-phosphate transaminase [Dysgonamonadaceae bacterium]|jgi:histidinol-phosphate aminotransferase|nr:histidinol-phosphate transaminase [Dysgonamonadaceae bacterium]
MDLQKLVRQNIWNLKPYSSARDEFKGEASVYLDANENPYNNDVNRYPDPLQWEVKEKISQIKGVAIKKIMLGNGSDEPIDLVFRVFCEPGIDNVVAIDPTYGMYQVSADINNVEYRKVLLNSDFDFNSDNLLQKTDKNTKAIFLCSPNNPTGNSLNRNEIVKTIENFAGIVVVDEAYIDFSSQKSFLNELDKYPNLIVLQTFSKAWAGAGIRLGMAFASEEIIRLFNKVKYPYNVNKLTQNYALNLLNNYQEVRDKVATILEERAKLQQELSNLSCVEKAYPTDSNFLLIKVGDADNMYQQLVNKGIIVRNRNKISLCMNCLRITVGTPEENKELITELANL